MLVVNNDKCILSVKLDKNYKYQVSGLKYIANDNEVLLCVKNIIEAIFNDGFDKVDHTHNLFDIILINDNGKFMLQLGSGQKYKLLDLYGKQFGELANTISGILINSVYNKSSKGMLQ